LKISMLFKKTQLTAQRDKTRFGLKTTKGEEIFFMTDEMTAIEWIAFLLHRIQAITRDFTIISFPRRTE